MDWTSGASTGGRLARRRRFTAASAAGAILAVASASIAFAEPLVGTGSSAEGTYLAVSTTGQASSSQGVAVSGTDTGSGSLASASGTRNEVTVKDPVTNETVGIENTGDADFPITPEQVLDMAYQAPPEAVAAKNQLFAKLNPEVEYQLAALQAGLDPTLADHACPDGRCPSRTRKLSQPLTHQWTSYYCGPASLALVIQQLTGTSQDQHVLARAANTTSKNGSVWTSLLRVLNQRQNRVRFVDAWLNDRPSSYMTRLVAATDAYDYSVAHSVINNVRTAPLTYWGKKAREAKHYNISHGYDLRYGGIVYVAEEYNSAAVGSSRSTNPYGYHAVPLHEMFGAILLHKSLIFW